MRSRGTGLAALASLVVLGGCGVPPAEQRVDQELPLIDAPLDNERYTILEMATAHGAFTIEVEVDSEVNAGMLARELVAPMQQNYSEVLVYFYDRAGDGQLPMKRVQWTEEGGYVEVEY